MNRPFDSKLTLILDRFDQAWQGGSPPDLELYLCDDSNRDIGFRRKAAIELVMIDLERRWRSTGDETHRSPADGESLPARPILEDYVARYSELGSIDALPPRLISEEYRVRPQWGDCPRHQEYLERFPAQAQRVRAALTRVDEDVAMATAVDGAARPPGAHRAGNVDDTQAHAASETSLGSASIGRETSVDLEVGGYEILDKIARGGMGIVYKARQKQANRVVALKMILAGRLADDDEVRRFRAEAEAAANLEHPNIVPIYEVGEHGGQPYFSMRFIDGQSLRDQVAEGPLRPKQAAITTKALAAAVHYAHLQGVVHRDLKPANVLLDRLGHPWITDFGLAKRLAADSGMTATGQVMGTPSYMPPEQAMGHVSQVGPMSDVYSLGAILYELLTGRPPFRAASPVETLAQVIDQEPVAPRKLNPLIDKDVETICLKCLRKRPAERYASADQLEKELGRYLAGEPVFARPVGSGRRMVRWCRRRPAAAIAAGASIALLLTIVVGGPIVAVRESRLRRVADHRAGEVQLALDETQRTIDQYVNTVERTELFHDARFRPLLRSLLTDALGNYRRFIERHGTDPNRQHDVADALERMGKIQYLLGEPAMSIDVYLSAIGMMETLMASEPTLENLRRMTGQMINLGASYQALGRTSDAFEVFTKGIGLIESAGEPDELGGNLALLLRNRAVLSDNAHRPAEAEQGLHRALAIQRRLVQSKPGDTSLLRHLAGTLSSLGDVAADMHEPDRALARHHEASEILVRIDKEVGSSVSALDLLANQIAVGIALSQLSRYDEAIVCLENAMVSAEKLIDAHPNIVEFQSKLAHMHYVLYSLYKVSSPEMAAAAAERSVAICRRVFNQVPASALYLDNFLRSLQLLSGSLTVHGDWQAVIDINEELLALMDAAESPGRRSHEVMVALARVERGTAKLMINDPTGADEDLKYGLDMLRNLQSRDRRAGEEDLLPGELEAAIADALYHRSLLLMRTDSAEAIRALEESERILTDLVSRYPANHEHMKDLAATSNNLGGMYYNAGRKDEGAALFVRTVEVFEQLLAAEPRDRIVRGRLSKAYANLAEHATSEGRLAEAERLLTRGVECATSVDEAVWDDPLRDDFRNVAGARAKLYERLGRHLDAMRDWADVVRHSSESDARQALAASVGLLDRGGHARAVGLACGAAAKLNVGHADYFAAAKTCGRAANLAADTVAETDGRDRVVDEYCRQAVDLLRRAREAGAFEDPVNVDQLNTDGAWKQVRQHPEFERIQ